MILSSLRVCCLRARTGAWLGGAAVRWQTDGATVVVPGHGKLDINSFYADGPYLNYVGMVSFAADFAIAPPPRELEVRWFGGRLKRTKVDTTTQRHASDAAPQATHNDTATRSDTAPQRHSDTQRHNDATTQWRKTGGERSGRRSSRCIRRRKTL